MFYNLDSTVRRQEFDLAAAGFLVNDRVEFDLSGYVRATIYSDSPYYAEIFQVHSFLIGGFSFGGDDPVTALIDSVSLKASNTDDPISDNQDSNGDYGILVRLAAFSENADTFSFRGRNVLPEFTTSAYAALGVMTWSFYPIASWRIMIPIPASWLERETTPCAAVSWRM